MQFGTAWVTAIGCLKLMFELFWSAWQGPRHVSHKADLVVKVTVFNTNGVCLPQITLIATIMANLANRIGTF